VASWQCRDLQLVPARRGGDTLLAARGPPGELLDFEQRIRLWPMGQELSAHSRLQKEGITYG
jgi:hypothetical protein